MEAQIYHAENNSKIFAVVHRYFGLSKRL